MRWITWFTFCYAEELKWSAMFLSEEYVKTDDLPIIQVSFKLWLNTLNLPYSSYIFLSHSWTLIQVIFQIHNYTIIYSRKMLKCLFISSYMSVSPYVLLQLFNGKHKSDKSQKTAVCSQVIRLPGLAWQDTQVCGLSPGMGPLNLKHLSQTEFFSDTHSSKHKDTLS